MHFKYNDNVYDFSVERNVKIEKMFKKLIKKYEEIPGNVMLLHENNNMAQLDLDSKIFQDNSNILYYGTSAYILHYPGNKTASISYGVIKKGDLTNDYERTGATVGARIVEKFETADEQKKVADILMTSGDFDESSDEERRMAFADFVTGVKKAAIERKVGDAMNKGDGAALIELLKIEDGLENLRKKLINTNLS